MKTKKFILKNLICLLLGVMFLTSSFMTITTLAASQTGQDGVDATLTSGKNSYASNEKIDLELTVINNNAYEVDGIQTEIILPDGITLESGNLTQKEFTLSANASEKNLITAIKKVETSSEKKNSDTGAADNNKSTTNTSVKTSQTTKSPQTGDETNLALWIIIMIVSFGMLIFIIGGRKLKAKGLLSVVICCAILGMLCHSVSAEAASTQKSFTITKEISVDGKNATISAKISYNCTAHNDLAVTDGTGSGIYAEGDVVTITANAAPEGQHFTGWTVESGNVTLADSTKETTTFTMPAEAVEVKANYAVDTYTATITNGTGSGTYVEGDVVTITAEAAPEGQHFIGWTVESGNVTLADGTKETTTFTMPAEAVEVKANYAVNTYTITVTVEGDSGAGIVYINGTDNMLIAGQSATYECKYDEGIHFKVDTVQGVTCYYTIKENGIGTVVTEKMTSDETYWYFFDGDGELNFEFRYE